VVKFTLEWRSVRARPDVVPHTMDSPSPWPSHRPQKSCTNPKVRKERLVLPQTTSNRTHALSSSSTHLARKIAKPTIGIATSTQSGFINRYLAYFWNRLRRAPLDVSVHPELMANTSEDGLTDEPTGEN